MKHDFKTQVSLYERDFLAWYYGHKYKILADKYGIICIGYDVNIFPWGSPIGGAKKAIPFSKKIPDIFYEHITYCDDPRCYCFLGKKFDRVYFSSDKKKAFIDMCGIDNVTYLIDVETGAILFMEKTHFSNVSLVEYNEKLYIFMKTKEGIIIFNDKFEDAIHEGRYKKIRGDIYGKHHIYNFYDGKYQIFDLEKNLLYKTTFKPSCHVRAICQEYFLHEGLMFTQNEISSILYSLVDLKNNTIVVKDFYLGLNDKLKKPGDITYDKDFNIVTLDRNAKTEKSNIYLLDFITEGNDIDDLKIYLDKKKKIKIAEKYDIPLEDDIEYIIDLEQGEELVINGAKNPHNIIRGEKLISFYSGDLNKIKVGFKNGSFNIYEKGKGWMYNNDDKEII